MNIGLSHKEFFHLFQKLLQYNLLFKCFKFYNLLYLKNKLVQLFEYFYLNYKEKNLSLRMTKLPLLPCSPKNLLLPLLCHHPVCAHMKERQKIISTVNWIWVRIFKKKRKLCSSLKFAIWNQRAIFNSSRFYFSLCKSQEDYSSWFTKRKIKMQAKLSK